MSVSVYGAAPAKGEVSDRSILCSKGSIENVCCLRSARAPLLCSATETQVFQYAFPTGQLCWFVHDIFSKLTSLATSF